MLIPLGSSCKVRESIQRYLNVADMETNMFDWTISNFNSVLYFIKHTDDLITESDFDSDFSKTNKISSGNICLRHRFLRFESIHDINAVNNYETEIICFLEKYNRRLQRLKKHILSNKKLDFIHLIDMIYNPKLPNKPLYIPSPEQINDFCNSILKVNPTCNFNLHILIPPSFCNFFGACTFDKTEIDKLKMNNVFVHYLYQNENVNPQMHQCQHWSWYELYKNITN